MRRLAQSLSNTFGVRTSYVSLVDGQRKVTRPRKKETRNDADREDWVNNDEDLQAWFLRARCSMRQFVRTNRAALDDYINEKLHAR